jgi:hypothetical protein
MNFGNVAVGGLSGTVAMTPAGVRSATVESLCRQRQEP